MKNGFAIGWKIEIYNVSIKCHKCKRRLYFQDQTFNSNNNSWEEVKDCCDNVIVYSVLEGEPGCSNAGKELQEKINKLRRAIQEMEKSFKKKKKKQKD